MAFGERRIPKHLIINDTYTRTSRPRRKNWPWLILALGLLLGSIALSQRSHAEIIDAPNCTEAYGVQATASSDCVNTEASAQAHSGVSAAWWLTLFGTLGFIFGRQMNEEE